ncbi:MAG: hypothetical protein GC160_01895 [Acidobacteria bacterium]|nr:hypothetical protein [Acidobacteriota bacterium]
MEFHHAGLILFHRGPGDDVPRREQRLHALPRGRRRPRPHFPRRAGRPLFRLGLCAVRAGAQRPGHASLAQGRHPGRA